MLYGVEMNLILFSLLLVTVKVSVHCLIIISSSYVRIKTTVMHY